MRLSLLAILAGSTATVGIAACGGDKKPEPINPTPTSTAAATSDMPAPSATSVESGGGTAPTAQATTDSACEALAKARCSKLESCNKTTFALHEGTIESCTTRTKHVCLYERAPKESGLAIDNLTSCAKAQEAASCEQALAGHLSGCERMDGKIEDGKACIFDAQCKTQFCTRAVGSSCGKCAASPKEGEACKEDRCGHGGFACVDKKCVKKKAKGEACKGEGQAGCEGNFFCLKGKCNAALKAGEKCDPKVAGECDPFEGLFCDKKEKTCKAYGLLKAGEACGDKVADKACPSDMTCEDDKCVPMAAMGTSCKETTGAMCDPPSLCIGGTCKVPDAAACK